MKQPIIVEQSCTVLQGQQQTFFLEGEVVYADPFNPTAEQLVASGSARVADPIEAAALRGRKSRSTYHFHSRPRDYWSP